MLIVGDCFTELKNVQRSSVDLIYLDPPFFTQSTHRLRNKDLMAEYSFRDEWENIETYANYIKQNLFFLVELVEGESFI